MDGQAITTRSDLERMLADKSEEPKPFSLPLLEAITDGFSVDQKIGSGAFADVYKGVVEDGIVAVKRMTRTREIDETSFLREVECLMKAKHKNVVRSLGYCCDTQQAAVTYEGKFAMADLPPQRFLCFEYLPNGSLKEFIAGASGQPEWRQSYRIIKGICKGLQYLHQKNIIHLDLKPDNILLDTNMVPKIVDFGISRCFDENQTHATTLKPSGTRGYYPPEQGQGKISPKCDIYSLGIIIMEILTGKKVYPDEDDEAGLHLWDNNVLEIWRDKLHKSKEDAQNELLRVCVKIWIECANLVPGKRPTAQDIIEWLDKTEAANGYTESEMRLASESKRLRVHPIQLTFPDGPKKEAEALCPLYLRNITNHDVKFRVRNKHSTKNFKLKPYVIISPMSSCTVAIEMEEQMKLWPDVGEFYILETTAENEQVEQFMLPVNLYVPPGPKKTSYEDGIGDDSTLIIPVEKHEMINCMDIHPTEPWIITSHEEPVENEEDRRVRIWNYQTLVVQSLVFSERKEAESFITKRFQVKSVKFIAHKKWIVAGTTDGVIYVYSYDPVEEIRTVIAHSEEITSLDTHASLPYVLSACWRDGTIKLWSYGDSWELMRTFSGQNSYLSSVAFNPKDNDTFASIDGTVKIWNLHSGECKLTLYDPDYVVCSFDYFSSGDKPYFIVGCTDYSAKIWDYETGSLVQTLQSHSAYVTAVCYDPDLPILITGSDSSYDDGSIRLWNSTNFRTEGVRRPYGLGDVYNILLCRLMGSRRIVIGYHNGFVVTKFEPVQVTTVESP